MEYEGEDNLEVLKLAENYNNFLIEKVALALREEDKIIVDFGSGQAYLTQLIEKRISKKIICIEPAANLRKYYTNNQRLDSLDDLKDNSVDFIYSLNVLEHIKDDMATIQQMHRKLKPNGKLVLYVPACEILYSSMDKKVGHYRRYSKAEIKRLFLNRQWKLQRVDYADFVGFFATLAYILIGAKDGKINPKTIKFYDKFLVKLSFFFDKLTFGKLLGKNIIAEVLKRDGQ